VPERRLAIVRALVVGGLLATFAIAPRLWLAHPFFGPVPVLDHLPALRPPLDGLWLALLVTGLLPLLHPRAPAKWLAAWTALLLARCIWDRITWQPYLLQYGVTMGVLAWAARAPRCEARARVALDALRLAMVAIYFWAGFSKLNVSFLEHGVRGVAGSLVGEELARTLQRLAVAVPLVEMGFAVALLLPRLRRAGVAAGWGMHLFILACIGPLGSGYNPIVWPWNLVMMGLLWLLFWDERESRWRDILAPGRWRAKQIVFTLFVVCPALGQLGLWDRYLSFPLYSASVATAQLYVSGPLEERVPEAVQAHVIPWRADPFVGYLPVPYWMEREIHAFMPPHRDNFLHTGRRVCAWAREDRDVGLVILAAPAPWQRQGEATELRCSDLRVPRRLRLPRSPRGRGSGRRWRRRPRSRSGRSRRRFRSSRTAW
jgi:uncharacterized membrane protein YphA (DoxX/SURF4 family)